MKINKNNSGFTLVEMLVTVFVFSMIMTIAGGIFVQALDLQRRAFDIQILEENGRFALEMMAREIRFGEVEDTNSDCPDSPASRLRIVHPVNGDITYSTMGRGVGRRGSGIVKTVNGERADLISRDEINVRQLGFCVTGDDEGDNQQPKVTIFMTLETGDREPQVINLQTTVTQRFLSD